VPIDFDKVLGAELPSGNHSWDADDVILYHLGLGAGVPPTDPGQLAYVYERELKVLPSFAVIPPFATLGGLADLDGFDVNLALLLHGEQELTLAGPIPTAGEVTTTATVKAVYDKGKGALVIVETVSADAAGNELFVNRFSSFLRGEGGFGGEGGPEPAPGAPEREPDAVVECPTLPQQALLYRLSGDKNPLHADPAYAAKGGFDAPILHGLCSFGVACKGAVDAVLEGDVARVGSYRARFAGVVFPGETLVVRAWREGDQVLLAAETKERGTPVLSNAAITVRSEE
jgi:acyl dehydratase